jgi:N6-L-threonylcarbamoyladenine synthase
MIHSHDLRFSFSGLKTAVLYALKEIGTPTQEQVMNVAREFEDAVTEVLISKTRLALEENEAKSLIIGGGVVANTHIRKAFEDLATQNSIPLYLPASGLSGDNALMIALSGSMKSEEAAKKPSSEGLRAIGNLSL